MKARVPHKTTPKAFTTKKALLGASISLILAAQCQAGPQGGEVVAGRGAISASGNTTTVNQASERLAIHWESFDLDTNERVNFIQPDTSSIALNRIMSNTGSHIQGRIDANGQVILVNPHGIMFGADAVVNAGGILASGLDIDPSAFMNGDFTFRALEGTAGHIVNQGLLNAASGGSVSLLGKKIDNQGMISAHLGSLNFAAGQEAVVTFGESGHVGVRVSESLLQEDIGIDPAIVNSGEIRAEGGKVLLTASTSRDIFSQAVNVGEMRHDNSIVMDADGSYTLGAGADIANSGSINVSGMHGGEIAIVASNISHSGTIEANGDASAGAVELHSTHELIASGDSLVSASSTGGQGGDVKLLGHHVGVFDGSRVLADGGAGGGQVLLGGDERGANAGIRNAKALVLGEDSEVSASALISGDGGRVIAYAEDYLAAFGSMRVIEGGEGSGGFIETSASQVNLSLSVDVGRNGAWLIDPWDIVISDSPDNALNDENPFQPDGESSNLNTVSLLDALTGGATVDVDTGATANGVPEGGNITLNSELDFGVTGDGTLILKAHNDININANILDSTGDSSLNLDLQANWAGPEDGAIADGVGSINIANGVIIQTNGGNFSASGVDFTNNGTINVASQSGGGDIDVSMDGNISLGAITLGDLDGDDDVFQEATFSVSGSSILLLDDIVYGETDSNRQQVIQASFTASSGDIIFDGVTINNATGENTFNLSLLNEGSVGDFIFRDTTSTGETNNRIFLTGGNFTVNGGRNFLMQAGGAEVKTAIATQGGNFQIGNITPLSGDFNSAPLNPDGSLNTGVEFHTYDMQFATMAIGDIHIDVLGNVNLGAMEYTVGDVSNWNYNGDDNFNFNILAGGSINVLAAEIPIDRYTGNGTNTITFNAGNAISLLGDISHNSNDSSTMTFTAGAGGFTNTGAINTNGGTLTIGDSDTAFVQLNGNIRSGLLNITATGNITSGESAEIFAGDFTTLQAGAEGDISLTHQNNDFDQAVTVLSARNVTLKDSDQMLVGGINIRGNLSLTAGKVDDTDNEYDLKGFNAESRLIVDGTTSLTAEQGEVSFDNANNDFGAAVSVTADSLTLRDRDDLVLGAIDLHSAGANSTISAADTISQASGNSIESTGGNLTITAESIQTNNITLTSDNVNGGNLVITASGTDSGGVSTGNITTSGGNIEITASGTDSGGVSTGNITTSGGNLEITAADTGSGGVSTGAITTSGGEIQNADDRGTNGASAGSITISAPGAIVVGAIEAIGSQSGDSDGTGNNNNPQGGSGGTVSLTSTGGGVSVSGQIDTRGGNGFAVGTGNSDDANGGDGGNVLITAEGAGAITLAGNIYAGGGHLYEGGNNTNGVANGESGRITLTGSVVLRADVTLDTSLRAAETDNRGSASYTLGDVTINGGLRGESRNLSIYAGEIALGSIDLSTSSESGNGGNFTVSGADVTVGTISTFGGSSSIIGGSGGAIAIVAGANQEGEAGIRLNGSVDARGGEGTGIAGMDGEAGRVSLSFGANVSSGTVDLAGVEFFFSDVSITGTDSTTDTLIGPSVETFWTTNATGGNLDTDQDLSSLASFLGFEILAGGTSADTFNLVARDQSITRIGGGDGDDIFNIYAGIAAPIFGDDGDDRVVLTATSGTHRWVISGTGAGSLSDGASFEGMEVLLGADGAEGNDEFRLEGSFGDTNAIDARGGEDALLVTRQESGLTTATVSFQDDFSGGIQNLEVLRAELSNGATAEDFILQLTGNNSDNNWSITGQNSGYLRDGVNTATDIRFENFATVVGDDGNDTVTFESGGSIRRFNGNAGTDRVDFRGLAMGIHVEIAGNELGDVDEVEDGRIRVANANSIYGYADTADASGINEVTLLGSANHRWGFEDLGLPDVSVDGVVDAQLTRTDGTGTELNLVNFGIFNGNDGNDDFVVNTAEFATIELNGGDGSNSLTGRNATNHWTLSGTTSLEGRLSNDADPDARSTIFDFVGIESLIGGGGQDHFTVDINATTNLGSIAISGGANQAGTSAGDTLTVLSSANSRTTAWSLEDENEGRATIVIDDVNRLAVNFSNIENLTGGAGRDIFNLNGGFVTGLIDGGEFLGEGDEPQDRLNIGPLRDIVVVVGENGDARPFIRDAEDYLYVNAWGIERYEASGETPKSNENTRWIVADRSSEMDWDLGQDLEGNDSGQNTGTVVEVVRRPDDSLLYDEQTRFFFRNFGSARGSGGVDTINDSDTLLTGTWDPFTGGQRLIYNDPNSLSLVYLTPDILSVTGNGGNVILAIAPQDSIEGVNFNGENAWRINGINSGTFTASYFSVGEGSEAQPFSFEFSGVNRFEGGSGSDVFTFSGAGNLINGYIAGGGGADSISVLADSVAALDFGISFRRTEATSPNGIYPLQTDLGPLFELNNRDGVVDIAGIENLVVDTGDRVSLRSAASGNFRWNFDGTLIDTDNNLTLAYLGINRVRGGSANDTFFINNSIATAGIDGGGGFDTVNLSLTRGTRANVDLGQSNGYTNIEAFVGNNNTSFIQGLSSNTLHTWTINGNNQGTVTYNNLNVSFSGFTRIEGSSGRDVFDVRAGTIDNGIFGGLGDDELNVYLGFTDTGAGAPGGGGASNSLRFVGGDGSNTANFFGGSADTRFDGAYTATVTPASLSQTFSYSITAPSATQSTRIALEGVGAISDEVYTNTFTVNDIEGQADNITLGANGFQVANLPQVLSRNNRNITVDAEAQDQLTINGVVRLDGGLRVNNASVSGAEPTSRVEADEFVRLVANTAVGSSDNRLAIETATLFLDDVKGAAFIAATGNIALGQLTTAGELVDISASGTITSGTITDSGVLASVGEVSLRSDANIVLDSSNNLSGILNLAAGGDILLTNGVTQLGDVQGQNLTVNTQSNVSDTGVINIANLTTINAAANSAVILDGEANQFNIINVNNARDVALIDSSNDGVRVGGSAADEFRVEASNAITANTIDANTISLRSRNGAVSTEGALSALSSVALIGDGVTVNGSVTVSNGAADTAITIDASGIDGTAQGQANINATLLANAGATTVTGTGVSVSAGAELQGRDIGLQSRAGITLAGDVEATGIVTLNAGGDVSQSGDITAASMDAIVDGELQMTAGASIQTTGNLVMDTTGDIGLSAINAGESAVTLMSNGAIVDTNGEAVNVTADTLVVRSENGFGGGGTAINANERIETVVANIDVLNDTGGIGVANSGDLNVTALISNSDVYLENLNGNVTLINQPDWIYDRSTSDARLAGGVINANYDFGRVAVSIPDGYMNATGLAFNERPDLVGDVVFVATRDGFGIGARQLVVYVRTQPEVSGPGIRPLWGFRTPPLFPLITDTDLLESSPSTSISELLVEVEELQDVDPAVFTDVRNYALDSSSIRMPRDQIYDNDIYSDDNSEETF